MIRSFHQTYGKICHGSTTKMKLLSLKPILIVHIGQQWILRYQNNNYFQHIILVAWIGEARKKRRQVVHKMEASQFSWTEAQIWWFIPQRYGIGSKGCISQRHESCECNRQSWRSARSLINLRFASTCQGHQFNDKN